MDQNTYVILGPGYWTADTDFSSAVTRMLRMYVNNEVDSKFEVFLVTPDWNFCGFSITATKVTKLPSLRIPKRITKNAHSILRELRDVTDEYLMDADQDLEEV